ncbi:MAG: VCBS repeat-containing protein, partial [Phycisphaerales bacterium]
MRTVRTVITLSALLSAGICVSLAGGCTKRPSKPPVRDTTLILSQAQFIREATPDGKGKSVPGPAKLVFLYPEGDAWTTEVVEDPDGNVFHKAMAFDLPDQQPGILTIAAHKAPNPATMKVWRRTADGWEGEPLWSQEFGGKFNRFRDVEIDDVTGDGKADIVVATHDQGVVAVLESQAGDWTPTVIDEKPDTFVHEIEIGDVDGDGQNEIFATPSAPNKADGTPQPGWVVMYKFDGESFNRTDIEHWDARHVKEILVSDVRGTGR